MNVTFFYRARYSFTSLLKNIWNLVLIFEALFFIVSYIIFFIMSYFEGDTFGEVWEFNLESWCRPLFRHGSPFLYSCRSHFSQASLPQRATCHILSDREESTSLFEAAVRLRHAENTFSWQLQEKGAAEGMCQEKKVATAEIVGRTKEREKRKKKEEDICFF